MKELFGPGQSAVFLKRVLLKDLVGQVRFLKSFKQLIQ